MNIAFLTAQYATGECSSGGVGSYISKMAFALREESHNVEIFVLSDIAKVLENEHGAKIQYIKAPDNISYLGLRKVIQKLLPKCLRDNLDIVVNSYLLNRAFSQRDAQVHFDIVQSTNFPQTGLFVRKREGRQHYLRLSTSRLLYDIAESRTITLSQKITEKIDVFCMKKADCVYAPSKYLAKYFSDEYGLNVDVVRPPAILCATPRNRVGIPLPDKYLVHYGVLSRRKGTAVVANALRKAWTRRPELAMVWVGRYSVYVGEHLRRKLQECSDRVVRLDSLSPSELYTVVSGSVASVLPSRSDNLPNTVIESLLLGVPVIGFMGASLDEVVESGKNGKLVPYGDSDALAEAMIEAWDNDKNWLPEGFDIRCIDNEMSPAAAVANFLSLGGSG